MINRSALLLRYKEPAVQWIRDANPVKGANNDAITVERVNEDRQVYLIDSNVLEDEQEFDRWLTINLVAIVEHELGEWYTDPAIWPSPINRELFDQWFGVECHSVVIDTLDAPIEEEDY